MSQQKQEQPNYYQILGVTQDAERAQIKKAYMALALANHPDKNPNNPEKAEKFKDISIAWAVLSDKEKRANYDLSIRDGYSDTYSQFYNASTPAQTTGGNLKPYFFLIPPVWIPKHWLNLSNAKENLKDIVEETDLLKNIDSAFKNMVFRQVFESEADAVVFLKSPEMRNKSHVFNQAYVVINICLDESQISEGSSTVHGNDYRVQDHHNNFLPRENIDIFVDLKRKGWSNDEILKHLQAVEDTKFKGKVHRYIGNTINIQHIASIIFYNIFHLEQPIITYEKRPELTYEAPPLATIEDSAHTALLQKIQSFAFSKDYDKYDGIRDIRPILKSNDPASEKAEKIAEISTRKKSDNLFSTMLKGILGREKDVESLYAVLSKAFTDPASALEGLKKLELKEEEKNRPQIEGPPL